jgi:ATP phosphoribosyltransferase
MLAASKLVMSARHGPAPFPEAAPVVTHSMAAVEGTVHLALPKGRMEANVTRLMGDAGIRLTFDRRGYRPTTSLEGFETKILKPQNIVEMLHAGSRDLGFAGADWVAEKGVELVELVDTGLDPVRIVAAADAGFLEDGRLPARRFVVATEYERLTRLWVTRKNLDATIVRSYGATEVFPPEDADLIVDNTATGATLKANGLVIVDEVLRSSTRLYACPQSLDDGVKRARIEHFALLVRSVLDARKRVMVEVNVGIDCLERVVEVLPCMREPTIAPLHHQAGFAVKAAVPRADLPALIARIKERGGTDIVVFEIAQIVP